MAMPSKPEPAQVEVIPMNALTVKPAVRRLIRRLSVRVIVLTLPSVRRPQVWV
jgi:hypothetical protein